MDDPVDHDAPVPAPDPAPRDGAPGRSVPGYGPLRPFGGAAVPVQGHRRSPTPDRPVRPKQVASIEAAFDACAIADGATLSFHHHLRNGDAVLNAVVAVAEARGLAGLRLAASAIFPVHAPLVDAIRKGVVAGIWTDYASGPVAGAIDAGALPRPAVFQTHGGRARAIETGQLAIDVAFIAAPLADRWGGAWGAEGAAACGPLGYPRVDADHARHVVVVAESLSPAPLERVDIAAGRVDHVVTLPSIGDPAAIVSGATRVADDPVAAAIAELAAEAIAASGALRPGLAFQTGAGGVPLAAVPRVGEAMRRAGVVGDYICGGLTGAHLRLVRAGLFRRVLNVQSFDREAVASVAADPWHRGISAAEYASPLHPRSAVDGLDIVLLGAAEIDRQFDVNVTVSGDGRIIGGPGGHPDAAAGAGLTVATTRLTAGGYPKVVERVLTVTTPGASVDLLVTERGIAVNPRRPALADRLVRRGLPVIEIGALIEAAAAAATRRPVMPGGDLRALIEYRDGTVIGRVGG
ncbi:MAG: citrate lyase subunit alpha [Pseudomonadota bacterium]